MKKTITTFVLFLFSIIAVNLLSAQTYFSDDFESGLSKWIVGGNNWDTLSTTYTSTNHCVTDSRIGNYTHNSDPTITMSQTLNITNSTFPVLSFFHRYNLRNCSGADNINVQISTNGGFSWSTIKSWINTNWAWTHVQIDLRNYKSNLLRIRFLLSSHNGCGQTADGWYLDDIKLLEFNTLYPTCSLPFNDNFENGMSKWRIGGFNWDTTSNNPSSGLYCATDSKSGNYTNSSEPTITMSCVVNLSNTTLPVLSLFHKYSLRNCSGADGAYLQISTNGGFDWITLEYWYNTNFAWTYQQYNLSNYRYDRVVIRYLVSSYNGCGQNADGAYLDDVSIYDLSPSAINLNLTAAFEGTYDPLSDQMSRGEKMRVYLKEVSSDTLTDSVVGYLDPHTMSGLFTFNGVPSGTYYIIMKNSSGLETWSQNGGEYLEQDNSTYDYDFTYAACRAYGCNQKLIGSRWCIYSGDVTQEGIIDLQDVIQIRSNAIIFATGYFPTDLNGDDLTDLTDILIANNNSVAFVQKVTP